MKRFVTVQIDKGGNWFSFDRSLSLHTEPRRTRRLSQAVTRFLNRQYGHESPPQHPLVRKQPQPQPIHGGLPCGYTTEANPDALFLEYQTLK